jgi:hypothetical protein
MIRRFRRTLTGVGLACGLALLATPVAQATPVRSVPVARTVHGASGWSLLHAVWSFLVGDPPGGKPSQGPTVDPNGGFTVH